MIAHGKLPKDEWYQFSCMIKGIDFSDEAVIEKFQKKMTLLFLKCSKESKGPVNIASVTLTKGLLKPPYYPEKVEMIG